MRTRNYLWAVLAAATLSLAACGGEENESMEPQLQDGMVKLELNVENIKLSNTKATGTLPTGDATDPTKDEGKITRLAIAIFNSDKSVNAIQEFTNITNFTQITMNCTVGKNCTGIAVANAPAKTFAGITKRDDFIKKVVDLDQTTLLMSGEIKETSAIPTTPSTTPFTLKAGQTSKLDVELERLVARVSISSIKTAFDASGQYANATFTLKQIFLHKSQFSYPVGPVGPTEPIPSQPTKITADFKTGWKNATPSTDIESSLSNDINPSNGTAITSGTPFTNPYWFYTFPNVDTNNSTRLVIFGTFDPDGPLPLNPTPEQSASDQQAVDYYYPVVINKLQTGTTIKDETNNTNVTVATTGKGDGTIAKNTKYSISATIKGKGGITPDADLAPATLDLTVSVAAWALNITQDVDFN